MALVARRAPICTLLQPVNVRLGWSWNPASPAEARVPGTPPPALSLRAPLRGAAAPPGEPRPPAAELAVFPVRRESREYFTTRLYTGSQYQTLLRTATHEHRLSRTLESRSESEAHRRHLVTETHERTVSRLREVFARREETRPPAAPVWIAPRPAAPATVPARTAEVEVRAVERDGTAPAPAAPPLNVDWVANQVIEQIDRRLVAYRERMGRF